MKLDRVSIVLWTAILAGGALRFAYVAYLPGQRGDLLHSDMAAYDQSGRAMAHGEAIKGTVGFNGFHPLSASTYYHVGYTWFVALMYWLAGDDHARWAAKLTQAALSTATIPTVYFIGKRLFSRPAGAIAAWMTAAHLPLVFYCGLLLTETPFIFLQMLALLLWLSTRERSSPFGAVLTGVVAGLACTVRTAFLPALAAWLVEFVWSGKSLRARLLVPLGLLLGAGLVILPVTARNLKIHGRLILLSTNGPATFHTGHVTHTFADAGIDPSITDANAAVELRQKNLEFLRNDWRKYLSEIPEFYSCIWLSSDFWPAQTTGWMYMPLDNQKNRGRVRVVADEHGGPEFAKVTHFPDLMRYSDQLLFVLVGLPAALLAPLFLPRSNRSWIVVYLTLLPYLIVPWIAPPFARYRVPACPLIFLLAGQTIAAGWTRRA